MLSLKPRLGRASQGQGGRDSELGWEAENKNVIPEGAWSLRAEDKGPVGGKMGGAPAQLVRSNHIY